MECVWISWCALKPEVQAAWVQAAGSILAIFIAILIPTAIELLKVRREHLTQARSLRRFLVVALPVLRSLNQTLGTYAAQISDDTEENPVLDVQAMDGKYETDAQTLTAMLAGADDIGNFTEDFADLQVYLSNIRYWNDVINDHLAGGLHHAWIRDKSFVMAAASTAAHKAGEIVERIESLVGKHVQSMFEQ